MKRPRLPPLAAEAPMTIDELQSKLAILRDNLTELADLLLAEP